MRKRDRRELERYLRACADLCELRDWIFRIDVVTLDETDDEQVQAMIHCCTGRKFAVLRVSPDTRKRISRDELRHTIAHELTHCHLDGLWTHATHNAVADALGTAAANIFHAAAEAHLEHAVDALASVIAPRLPLIEWPG